MDLYKIAVRPMIFFRIIGWILLLLWPVQLWAFDWQYEGRLRLSSQYLFDPPAARSHFDNEVELRTGFVGTVLEYNDWTLDYEVVGDLLYTGGVREESGLAEEYDAELFRGWLRLEKGNFKIRGGRQQILFGSGVLFRPLGFFDTRNVSGIIPLTRGVDGVRTTYFLSDTSLVEGWAVSTDLDSHAIIGLRGERQFGLLEAGAVLQYHPVTDLLFLPEFNQELVQMGYHLKGEKEIGFWNESRLDIELNKKGSPVRFDTVFGIDYTFDLGQGLHVLLEYFLTTQEKQFTQLDLKGDRLIQEVGLQLDQPIGIEIVWRAFIFYDVSDQSFQFVPQIEYNIYEQIFLYVQAQIGGSVNGNNRTGRLFRDAPVLTGTESRVGAALIAYF